MKTKTLFILPLLFFIFGSALVLFTLWPTQFANIERDFPTQIQIDDENLSIPAYRMVFRYIPCLKAGIQNAYRLQLIHLDDGTESSYPGTWESNTVELIVHLEMENPNFIVEPFSHVHLPWRAGEGIATTWNVRADIAARSSANLWIYLHLMPFSGDPELEIPLFAIKINQISQTILGMRVDLAVVVGGIGIFIAIISATLMVFFRIGKGKQGNAKRMQRRSNRSAR